jgi:hypothetical protein
MRRRALARRPIIKKRGDSLIDSVAMPHMFPMIRAGGLFILIMGIGVIFGALWPRRRMAMLIAGGTGATLAIILTADLLTRPLGVPTRTQFWALAAAIALEIVLIGIVVARYKRAGERPFLLAILLVVGLHFLPMAITFGPLCAVLGLCAMANAGIGLSISRDISLNRLWVIDGVLKLSFGSFMFAVAGSTPIA